ncbi:SPOR domain-containing protein [Zhouia sp. PK063]|uniref:SPOR domain-containing protein n=1 Tax=Zhouia sp. PK063 TaxID=3373602 RepID=UPI0037AB7AE7
MPYIEEKDLQELHDQVWKSNEQQLALQKEFDEEKSKIKKVKLWKNIFLITTLLLVLIFVFFLIKYPNILDATKSSSTKVPDGMVMVKETKIDALNHKIDSLSNVNNQLETQAGAKTPNPEDYKDQTIYAVQIAALEKRDLSMYSDEFMNMHQYKVGNFNKYAIGMFATLKEAQQFRREIKKLGFRTAFVASYKNGKRIRIEEPN